MSNYSLQSLMIFEEVYKHRFHDGSKVQRSTCPLRIIVPELCVDVRRWEIHKSVFISRFKTKLETPVKLLGESDTRRPLERSGRVTKYGKIKIFTQGLIIIPVYRYDLTYLSEEMKPGIQRKNFNKKIKFSTDRMRI